MGVCNFQSQDVHDQGLAWIPAGSDADLWTYGMKLSLRPCWQESLYSENLKSNLMQPASTSDAIRDEDQGFFLSLLLLLLFFV